MCWRISWLPTLPLLAALAFSAAPSAKAWFLRGSVAQGNPGVATAMTASSYTLPSTASTTIGTLSMSYSGTVLTAPTYSIVTSGTDNSGLACPTSGSTNFSVSGSTLSTASGYSSAYTAYVCIQAALSGAPNYVQRMMFNQSTPRFTAVQAIGGVQTKTEAYPTWWQQLGPAYGWSITGRGTGSPLYACGAAVGTFIADATGTIGTTGNPMFAVMIGEDDANTYSAGSYESIYKDCLTADLAWLSYPSKVLATSATQGNSNHWSAYSTTGLSSGTILQSSTAGDSLSFSVPVTKGIANTFSVATGVIYVWVGALNSDGTAQVTWSVDGGSSTTVTLDNYQTSVGMQAIRIGSLSIATHTLLITISTLGTATSGIIVAGAGTANTAYADQVAVAGVLKQQSNANATATQDYDTDTATVILALDSDFMDVIYAPVRNYVSTSTDYSSALNLNASGQTHVANAFQENWYPCIIGATDASSNPVAPPSWASSNGFTCLKFDDEGMTLSTVDTGNTLAAGFNWYTPVNWPNSGESSPNHWNAFTPSSALPWNSGQISQDSSGLLINVSISVTGAPVLSSCAPTSGARAATETPPFIVGKQFSGANGFYVEDELTWNSGNYYTAWMLPTEQLDHQVGSPGTWAARVFVETDNPDEGVNEQKDWMWKSVSGTTTGPIFAISTLTSDVSGDAYGQLLLSSSKTTSGHAKQWFYINSSQFSEQGDDQYFDDFAEEHQCLLLNGEATQKLHQRYFRFWQDPL
jgi:hypothetical protein